MKETDKNASDFFYEDYNVSEIENDFKTLLTEAIEADTALRARICFNFLIKAYVKHNPNIDHEHAVKEVKNKLGYFAGYYSNEQRQRVEELYDVEHPILGRFSEMGAPTPSEAMQCGMLYVKDPTITLKKLRERNSNLEMLEKELEELRASNKSAWESYGSELCAGDMIAQERRLENLIKDLKNKKV